MGGTTISSDRLTEDGFRANLKEITEGLKNFPVNNRSHWSATTPAAHHSNDQTDVSLVVQKPTQTTAPSTLPTSSSPQASPHKQSTSAVVAEDSTMNFSPMHGAPRRDPSRSPYGSQDARSSSKAGAKSSNIIGRVSLKKAAVRIARPAGPAGPAPGTPNRVVAPAPPIVAAPKVEDRHAVPKPTASAVPAPAVKADFPSSIHKEEAALEELFARLNSPSAPSTATPTPTASTKQPVSLGAKIVDSTNASMSRSPSNKVQAPTFKEGLGAIKKEPVGDVQLRPAPVEFAYEKGSSGKSNERMTKEVQDMKSETASAEDIERDYIQKAAEYVASLPSGVGPTAELVKNVITKLRRPHTPSVNLEADIVEGLKARYVDALVNFLEGINKDKKAVSKDQIEEILVKGDGNFLHLCAVLAEKAFITLEDLDQVVGLSKAVESIVSENQDTASSKPARPAGWKDPMDGKKSWPAREERANVPGCRTCYITGLPENISFNKLQALVWGGRLESLKIPLPGSGKAIVKFLAPEACEKYFDASENGITLPGSKNVILVEKAPGPNSVNDFVAGCNEGDATRCVKAYDADEDWSDVLLMKLATGAPGCQPKRDVDVIKRGKTAQGRSFIEFRFADIRHAVQFKRELMSDDDWEHCTIVHSPDPCETAQGVHIKDEDEKE